MGLCASEAGSHSHRTKHCGCDGGGSGRAVGGRSIRRACPLLFPKNESVARGEGQQRTRVKSRGGCLTGHLRKDLQSGLSALAYGCCHMILSSSIFHSPMSLFGLLKEVAHPARRPAWETVDVTLGTAKAFKSFKTCTLERRFRGFGPLCCPIKTAFCFIVPVFLLISEETGKEIRPGKVS